MIMRNTLLSASILSGFSLLGLAAEAQAKDVYLAAVRTCITPAGVGAGNCTAVNDPIAPVPVWSLMSITKAEFDAGALTTTLLSSGTVPGPLLNVDSGDTSGLTIHLLNLLPVPTSLIIPGQPAALNPTWIDSSGAVTSTGARKAGDTTSRVRSLNTETQPNKTGTYTWKSPLKPGSYIYESATHQGIQVQMGLHGGLIVADGTSAGATSGTAYGLTYKQQVATYLTEIDAAMHRTIDTSPTNDATPAGSATKVSPLDYSPNIFLTTQTALTPDFSAMPVNNGHNQILVNQPTLMRFFNGTLRTHVQMVQDENISIIAEDGNAYRYPKAQYSAMLDASKTKDALMVPASLETVAVYDHMLNTGNPGNAKQGMLAFLEISAKPVATADTYSATGTTPLVVAAAQGVLANDTGTGLTATLVTGPTNGMLTTPLSAKGAFGYTAKASFTGPDTFTYTATNFFGTSAPATVTINVAAQAVAPVANNDTAGVAHGTTKSVPNSVVINVLTNDTGATGFKSVNIVSTSRGTATVNADGTIKYVAPTNKGNGTATITYTFTNAAGVKSNQATVTITVS
jgi:FtsP/CotA-like multicopper oxidase with cupredoxin domain